MIQMAAFTGDVAAAEDLVQEAFGRCVAKWAQVAGYDDPEAWVRSVAYNLARSRWRRLKRGARALTRLRRGEAQSGPDAENIGLMMAVSRLGEDEREVIVRHYLLDQPVAVVAAQLGIPEGTVKSRLARARAQLAEMLANRRTRGGPPWMTRRRPTSKRGFDTLRASILERPAPGLDDARRRFRTRRRRPVQLAVFVTGVAVLVAALVVYGVNPAAQSTPAHPGSESVLAQKIDKFAEQTAARAGDSRITEVLWVATNARAAAALNGGGISEHGSRLPGRGPGLVHLGQRLGSVLRFGCRAAACEFLVVDRSTFNVSEFGVGQSLDDLGKLGTVHVDRLRNRPLFPPTTVTTITRWTERLLRIKPGTRGVRRSRTEGGRRHFQRNLRNPGAASKRGHGREGRPPRTSRLHVADVRIVDVRGGPGRVRRASTCGCARPHSTAFCTRYNTLNWSCEQTSLTFPQGNGWSLAAAYYLPLTELYGIEQSDAGFDDEQAGRRRTAGRLPDRQGREQRRNPRLVHHLERSAGVVLGSSAERRPRIRRLPRRRDDHFGLVVGTGIGFHSAVNTGSVHRDGRSAQPLSGGRDSSGGGRNRYL